MSKSTAPVGQIDIFSLLDDPSFVPAASLPSPRSIPPVPSSPVQTVTGWVKAYQGPKREGEWPTELPCLQVCKGDGHSYRPAVFTLAAGVSVGDYPGGFGNRGLRVGSAKELISLYDAVRQGLATEVTL